MFRRNGKHSQSVIQTLDHSRSFVFVPKIFQGLAKRVE